MNSFPMPITAIYAGLLGIMLVPMSAYVSVLRGRTKIMFFDGGNPDLGRAIRAQGNFTEYVPLALFLMGLVEWAGMQHWVIHALGVALVASRLLHAWGLYTHKDIGRGIGATVTWIVLSVGGVLALLAGLGRLT
jgi:uncharacterized protein